MIFADKPANSIARIKIGKLTIKSKVYKYQEVFNILFAFDLVNEYILKLSPFLVQIGRKEKEIHFFNKEDKDILFRTFFEKKIDNKNFTEYKDNIPFNWYVKRRLGVLGIIMKQYSIDKIGVKELLKFIMYKLNNIDLAKKLANYLYYLEEYTLADIRKLYTGCCPKDNIDMKMYNYIKLLYKLVDKDSEEEKAKVQEFKELKLKVIDIISEIYDIPKNILHTYNKTISKLVNYIIAKQLTEEKVKKLVKKYKGSADNIHLDIANLVTNAKLKSKVNENALPTLDGVETEL